MTTDNVAPAQPIDDQTQTANESLDCSGLLCPLPVYKAAMILNRLEPGQTLELITTDPGALEDIPAMAKQRGDVLLTLDNQPHEQRFLIEKGGSQ